MDIGELLAYKPPPTPKRPLPGDEDDDDAEENYQREKKLKRLAKMKVLNEDKLWEEQVKAQREREEAQVQKEVVKKIEIEELLENNTASSEVLDDSTLKKMVLMFEKRALKNQEMRIKFPENPEKFMESELELHEVIQELHVVATMPDLYPLMVQLNSISSLLDLLSHENTDISVAIVDLLQELTDADILNESDEGANALIEALTKHEACALLVQNLERLDEKVKEESDGVHNTLAIFENILEFRADMLAEVGKQGLLLWLLKRLRMKVPFESNKLYVSEILAILLGNKENRLLLGQSDGVDILLQQLAYYKRHDPASDEEHEMMENLFDCLCSTLIEQENRERFLVGEGLQLMNLMLREKKLSRNGSLKVLDHAMSGPFGVDNSNKFVDILGLRTIFPLFMKTPKRNKKRTLSVEEHEEHTVSIISSMLRHCLAPQRQRLINKFVENDHEKVDRLLELHFKYLEKMNEIDAKVDKLKQNRAMTDTEQESLEDEMYLERLEGGLYTLQLVDYIILEVCTGGPGSIKHRVMQILNLRGGSLKTIRHIMREYAGNLGDVGSVEWKAEQQEHVLQLIDKF